MRVTACCPLLVSLCVYKSFSVRGFRTFERLELDGLKRINVISGKNDTGKSSLLEALYLHASGPVAGTAAVNTLRGLRGLSGLNVSPGSQEGPWDFLFQVENPESLITLDASTDRGRYSLSLQLGKGGIQQDSLADPHGSSGSLWSRSLTIIERRGQRANTRYTQTVTMRSVGSQPGVPTLPGGVVVNSELNPVATAPFEVAILSAPRGRSTAESLAASYSELRQKGGREDLLRALQKVDGRIQGVEVLVSEGRPLLWATLSDGNLLPFYRLGEAVSSVAGYLLGLTDAGSGGLILIDEIENGLHYSIMRQVWRELYENARSQGRQVVATTHSRECLVAAWQELREEKGALKLFRLTRGRNTDGPVEAVAYDQQRLDAGFEMDVDLR
jgi:AAA domain, putative AbiEii toxin, Type IV TA system